MTDLSNGELSEIKNELKNQSAIIGEIKSFLAKVSDSLNKLAEIQAHQEEHSDAIRRCFSRTEEHAKRIWNIEQQLPALVIAKNITFGLVTMILTGVIGALVALVIVS